MFERGEIYEGYEQHRIVCDVEPKYTPNEAIKHLLEFRDSLPEKTLTHYNRIIINSRIDLWLPGEYDDKNYGDYLLTWDSKKTKHEDIGSALINAISNSDNPRTAYLSWMKLLEDVYANGTINADSYIDDKQRFAVHLLFWVTLQEDINKPNQMGRLRPFCRYAEALSTTQKGVEHSFEEVKHRMDDHNPESLEKWELPYIPSFYSWNECAW